ncbi:2-oxo-3-hexenedioate decarboxylase [Burkholderiales bacterium]|nr:2-oxo-3-hexenedioate decarboxylase [Burkholderiales bacterium]
MPEPNPDPTLVDRLLAAADGGPALAPITDTDPHFGVERAYETLAALHARRIAQGWRPVGRKIGFTNRTIWPRYGVFRPMWSHVWDRTVLDAGDGRATVDVAGMHEPRIEPEVVFGLAAPPPATGGAREVLDAVGWIAAGFEIVHSIFPGWKFRAPDCTAAFGLHGKLVVGPRLAIGDDERDALAALLPTFVVTLRNQGRTVDSGVGANVLDSPANALVHLRDVLAAQPRFAALAAGEVVTTGTITDAWPVASGDVWTSDYGKLPVRGLELAIA